MKKTERTFLTVAEAASEIGVHPETIRRWCRDGHIPALKFGTGRRGHWRIRRTDWDEWVVAQIQLIQSQKRY